MPPRAVRPAATLLAALAAGACGVTQSPSYGRPVDAGADADVTYYRPQDAEPEPEDAAVVVPDARGTNPGRGAPYPLVLHHGFAGFRELGSINYFYNVARDLRARGETVYESEVSPFLPPQDRARELAAFVDRVRAETGAAKVVIIGHSQGGLDPRYMISSMGYGDRVALLATIATPHRGSRVADAVVGNAPDNVDGFADAIATVFGYAYNEVRNRAELRRAVTALTESAALDFNRQNPDDPRVVYWSWTGRSNRRTGYRQCAGARIPNDPTRVDDVFAPFYPLAVLLEQGDPDAHVNDGLVEVASARWGLFMGCVPADHFDEVGQIARQGPVPGSGFDHIAFYRDVVRRVREAGY